METERSIVYVKPNHNQFCRMKLGEFNEPYISIEALKNILSKKVKPKEIFFFDNGWNSALRDILKTIESENIQI